MTPSNTSSTTPSASADSLTVRVGILEDYERVTFQLHGRYVVTTLQGDVIRVLEPSNLKWRARLERSQPARFLYAVLVTVTRDREQAFATAARFEEQNLPAVVREVGGPLEIGGRVIASNLQYRVQVGHFTRETDAQHLADSLDEADFVPRLVRDVLQPAQGTIEVFDANLVETFSGEDGLRLIPDSPDARLTIFGVLTGSGFRYEKSEPRDYGGVIELYVDHAGRLAVINELSIDAYLRGVVPSEMPAGFPHEALKVQAILARSVLLAEKNTKHLNDPYDLCAHVHCQVYGGVTQEDPRTSAAVEETRGQVLVYNGALVQAYYSAVCGGHTEDAEAAWIVPSGNAAVGRPCSCDEKLVVPDLTTEAGVRRWVRSSPNVCCNLDGVDLPVAPDYGRRHFRWEVTYSRAELEEILRKKTGVDVGTLYDILPIRRGRSGRLIEIDVLGSRRNLRIKRELKIRRALSPTALESSCFVVDVVQDAHGQPLEFVFTGAGWGHGVGLCQCGAARMAAEGKSAEEIIRFYFPAAEIVTVY